jgi:hypothetical protein
VLAQKAFCVARGEPAWDSIHPDQGQGTADIPAFPENLNGPLLVQPMADALAVEDRVIVGHSRRRHPIHDE